MIKQGANTGILQWILSLLNSNAATNIIPAINAMKKPLTINQKFGKKRNGTPKQSYAVCAKKS